MFESNVKLGIAYTSKIFMNLEFRFESNVKLGIAYTEYHLI